MLCCLDELNNFRANNKLKILFVKFYILSAAAAKHYGNSYDIIYFAAKILFLLLQFTVCVHRSAIFWHNHSCFPQSFILNTIYYNYESF